MVIRSLLKIILVYAFCFLCQIIPINKFDILELHLLFNMPTSYKLLKFVLEAVL